MTAYADLRSALESGAVSLDSLMEFIELLASEQDVIDYFTSDQPEAEQADPASALVDALPDEGYQALVDYWGSELDDAFTPEDSPSA